MVTISGSDKGN